MSDHINNKIYRQVFSIEIEDFIFSISDNMMIIPFVLRRLGVAFIVIGYVIADNLDSSTAAVVFLKYLAVADGLMSLEITQITVEKQETFLFLSYPLSKFSTISNI